MVQTKGLMTEGSIWKKLLWFSIPLLLGNLFQQLYNTVDSVIVGNYIGGDALAAVGTSTPIINLLVGLFSGMATGAGVVISRYFGAQDDRGVHDSVHTTLAVTIVGGLFLTVVGVAFSPARLPLVSYLFIKKIQFCSLSLLTEQLFTCYNMNSSSGTCVPDGFATNIVILE